MAVKKIRHAIFEWFDPHGTRHYAFRGDSVDIPDHVVEAFDDLGAFDDSSVPADSDSADSDSAADDPSENLGGQPAKTAPVKAWREYAVAQGFDADEAEKMDRKALIEALA